MINVVDQWAGIREVGDFDARSNDSASFTGMTMIKLFYDISGHFQSMAIIDRIYLELSEFSKVFSSFGAFYIQIIQMAFPA